MAQIYEIREGDLLHTMRMLGDVEPGVYVVVGDGPQRGTVKTVRCSPSKTCDHLIDSDFRKVKKDGVPMRLVKRLQLNQEYLDRGWCFLKELYEQEGRMAAYEQFLSFQRACDRGTVRKPKPDADELVPGFPNKLLPKRCLELRAEQREAPQWQPDLADAWEPDMADASEPDMADASEPDMADASEPEPEPEVIESGTTQAAAEYSNPRGRKPRSKKKAGDA